jgi:hypothetical protein
MAMTLKGLTTFEAVFAREMEADLKESCRTTKQGESYRCRG